MAKKVTIVSVLSTYFKCKNCEYLSGCKVRYNPEKQLKLSGMRHFYCKKDEEDKIMKLKMP